ncbi:MAG: hypothetical protein MJ230_01055 [bacterium]|nr:hypothetical protein [bacterium]
MSDSFNCAGMQNPCYSGITINITNPSTAFPSPSNTQQKGQHPSVYAITNPNAQQLPYNVDGNNRIEPINANCTDNRAYNNKNIYQIENHEGSLPQAYPSEYYINNYNSNQIHTTNPIGETNREATLQLQSTGNSQEEINTDISQEIINELDLKNAEQKELEKNGKKEKVVALTNEYIMSLENYLNNPNTEIRLMAAKEILTRLDEDKNRYNDAALNALLNKMLQDPNKLVRIAAMSAFSSELASGNDYTIQLLKQIQQNPEADPEDVLEASQILLKQSTSTEVRYTPVVNNELQTVNKPNIQTQQKVEMQ